MPDLDENLEGSKSQDGGKGSEKMDQPGKKGGIVPLLFMVAVVGLLMFFIFKPKPIETGSTVDSLEEETVETIDDSRSKRARLDIPEPEKEVSLKDQLRERKENREEKAPDPETVSEVVIIEKDDKGDNDRASKLRALLSDERNRREQEAKEKEEREERMRQRMRAGMSENPGTHNWGEGSSGGSPRLSRVSSEKQDLLNKRKNAEALQQKILSGELGNSDRKNALLNLRGQGSGSNTDGTLLNLPKSSSSIVEAVSLESTDYMLTEGTIIQATLESAINSNLPGKIRAIVNAPVYSYSGNGKLIDSTSELIGQYRAASDGGEPRVFVIWTRLITSDGISVQLDSQGIDSLGRSGASGWVDSHFLKRFGASVMLSIIGGFTQPDGDSQQSQAIADSFNKSAEIALNSSINIKPTVKLNQGQRIAVFVNQDISFEAALKSRRVNRLSVNEAPQHPISYDRVFDETPLSVEERALLGNRFIADDKSVLMESNVQKPYIAEKDTSLRAVVSDWGRRGRYTVHWLVKDKEGNELDWRIPTDVSMHGTLHHVIGRLLTSYKRAGVHLTHQFFKENKVLVIRMSEGDQL